MTPTPRPTPPPPDAGPPSVWWSLADRSGTSLAPRPALEGDIRAHTLIVGGGVVGASLAVALARRADGAGHAGDERGGDGIVLLDREHPGAGATGRNAGFLLADSECLSLAAAMHGAAAADALRAAGLATRDFVASLEGPTFRVARTGSVRLASDRVEARHFESTAAAGLAGVQLEPVGSVAERGRAPYLAALADDLDGQIDPLALLAALLDEADRRGVRRFDATPVLGLRARAAARVHPGRSGSPNRSPSADAAADLAETAANAADAATGATAPSASAPVAAARASRGGLVVATTPGGRITADRIVICTNADARRLVPGAVRVRPVRAQALAAHVAPPLAWRRPTYATRGGDYWRLLPDGRVLLGGMRRTARRDENTPARSPTAAVQAELDALLRRLIGPDARVEVTHRWAGTMGFTPDGCPFVGAAAPAPSAARDAAPSAPCAPSVHVLAGCNGHGMGWGPGLAASLADWLDGAGPPPSPLFAPGRAFTRPG